MHASAILHEVQQLYNVSDRLDSLAGYVAAKFLEGDS
jgi:hypothetical protein